MKRRPATYFHLSENYLYRKFSLTGFSAVAPSRTHPLCVPLLALSL
jgi:hypothetical protein